MTARLFRVATAISAALLAACESPKVTGTLRSAGDPASFITHGDLDGNGHPAVVLLVLDSAGAPAYRCSATLLSPTVVLTAGHCVGEPGEFSGWRIFTEADVDTGNNNYPNPGPNTIEAKEAHAFPGFTENLFFLHDVGVVILKTPYNLPASAYGKLPTAGQLDGLKNGANTTFTAVGYGAQLINPVKEVAARVRMVAEPHLIRINSPSVGTFSMVLSNNASTGGTCFGDSGGPNYLGSSNVIAGTTSFGRNGNCAGTGGVFRLDKQDVIDFVSQYLK